MRRRRRREREEGGRGREEMHKQGKEKEKPTLFFSYESSTLNLKAFWNFFQANQSATNFLDNDFSS